MLKLCVLNKAGRLLNALRKKSKLLNMSCKVKLFNAFIRSIFSYCPLIWMNRNKTDMNRLEKIQERALRMVFNDNWATYDELLTRAKLPTLQNMWKTMLVTEVYKAHHKLSPTYISELFMCKDSDYDLRNNSPMVQPKCKSTKHGLNSLRYDVGKNRPQWTNATPLRYIWEDVPDKHTKPPQAIPPPPPPIRAHIHLPPARPPPITPFVEIPGGVL